MTQAAKAPEPSMEEILASIRRIIAEDEPTTAKVPNAVSPRSPSLNSLPLDPPASAAVAAQEDEADVLDLAEAEESAAAPVPGFRTIDGRPDVEFEDAGEYAPPPRLSRAANLLTQARAQFESGNGDRLLSVGATAAVDSAFNSLAETVLGQNSQTLEDLVRDMLRPLLKSWLDDNLPGLVERLVRAEIERVSRGHG